MSSEFKALFPKNGEGKPCVDGTVKDQSFSFEKACELMKKNVAVSFDDDSTSSEDEIDEHSILERTFSHYSSNDSGGFMKAGEYMFEVMVSGALVCLICIETIKRKDEVWTCMYCYGILHLHCIQKWSKESMCNKATISEESAKTCLKWFCPKCRGEYIPTKSIKYLCFCGKVENPVYDPWSVPHSCGKICDRLLKPSCSHTCSLLCHPGPCPPCSQTVLISCSCSKSNPALRRCSNKDWTCGKRCEKQLSCSFHFCENLCHIGPCLPCKKQSEKACACGKKTSLQPCDSSQWNCGTVCGKELKCGNHVCQIICHDGICPECPNSGPRSCPCSKMLVSLPCTDIVMPCGDTCDKMLECGLHRCSQKCHFGSCEKCLQMRIMNCRCGQKEKYMPCCKEFFCDTKCKQRRDCGRHFCNKKCCIGPCPPCEAICGRNLNCGLHKCQNICHSGPCYPCKETLTISCNCGETKITVPCGRRKSIRPPSCSADCKLPSNCHHAQRQKHPCHSGSCPPCNLICNKTLICGHKCPVKCHTAVLTKIDVKEKKSGPWDLINSYKTELIEKPCPPCIEIVSKLCLGGHKILNFQCYEARVISCGELCSRQLLCGNHVCQKECHKTSNNTDNNMQSEECEPCEEMCMKKRNPGCNHPCTKYCHPGDCNPCQQSIKMKCHCGINVLYIICSSWVIADDFEKDKLLSCTNRCPKEMLCGHRCYLPCHSGNCGNPEGCKKKISLRCPCKYKKKEMQCFMQLKSVALTCDEECVKHKELIEIAKFKNEMKQMEEEKKKQEEELIEFLRKTEGKKKKKKKKEKDIQNHPQNGRFFLYVLFFTIFLTACLLYFMIH